jgi:hypothetical protein
MATRLTSSQHGARLARNHSPKTNEKTPGACRLARDEWEAMIARVRSGSKRSAGLGSMR